jgi:ubiquitin-activating enzyme E1
VDGGETSVVVQTEMLIDDMFWDPDMLNKACRIANKGDSNTGFILCQGTGPWGFTFLDYGDNHVITDDNGEQTKNFMIVSIKKGETTIVELLNDSINPQRHNYQEGDHIIFREVEGMTALNDFKDTKTAIKIKSTTPWTLTLELDSREFADYTRQGLVENIKVPQKCPFQSFSTSFANPAGSTAHGMIEPPDLAKFGRSEQLHVALFGI